MFFASFHFFIFSILRITINCNYLFTKHYKYKTLIYLCQRPPPEKFVVFYLYKRWVGERWLCVVADAVISAWLGYWISQMLFRMRWYLQEWDIRYRRCFLDAAVSARVGYSISQMLFLMRRYLQEWDIRCCGCFFPATHV